jgi:hypothetical protein
MIDYSLILTRKYPNARWTLNGDEYAGLTWLSDVPKPTKAELDALWDEVKQDVIDEQNAKIAKKQSALSKLEALGLTIDDLKALGLG